MRRATGSACGLAVALLLAACGGDRTPAAASWAGTIDTLPGGTILVDNPARGVWDSTSAWQLAEDLRIGASEGDGPDVLSDVHSLAVDGAGRVYVLQHQQRTVHVFDSTGRFVRAVGRPGKGPGELAFPNGLALDGRGRLWIPDPRNARYTVYDSLGQPDGAFLRKLGGYSFSWVGTIDAEGRLLEEIGVSGDGGRATAFVRFDTSFTRADTVLRSAFEPREATLANTFVLEQGAQTLYLFVPFAARDLTTLDPRGYVWTANTGAYRLVQRDWAGDTVRVITRAAEPLPVSDDERTRAIARLDSLAKGARYDAARIPRTHPLFERMTVGDDGHVWVTLVGREGDAVQRIDVFDPEGRYLGQVEAPAGFGAPMRATAGALYGVVRDELDVPAVVRLRVARHPAAARDDN